MNGNKRIPNKGLFLIMEPQLVEKTTNIFIISGEIEGKEDSMTIDGGFLPISKKVVTLRERVENNHNSTSLF